MTYDLASVMPQPEKPKRRLRWWWVAAGVAFMICLALLIWGVVRSLDRGGAPVPKDGHDAASACERFVRGQLKVPSSASFSGVAWTGSPPRWTVGGAVDADNSFGGTVRRQWTCTVTLNGDTWTVESLTMTGLS